MLAESSGEYTLSGVLHYLQVEWRRFDRERNEWAIERAELKSRAALLEGERRGMENARLELMRKVKMLEYALRQERRRYMEQTRAQQASRELASSPEDSGKFELPKLPQEVNTEPNEATTKARERSRKTLKSCLQEINYLTSLPTRFPLTHMLGSDMPRAQDMSNRPPSDDTSSPYPGVPNRPLQQNRTPRMTGAVTKSKGNSTRSVSDQSEVLQDGSVSFAQDHPQPPMPDMKPPSPPPVESLDSGVPANVDEVAMMQSQPGIDDDDGGADPSPNVKVSDPEIDESPEALSKEVQLRYNLSDEKVQRMFNSARKSVRRNDRSSPELASQDTLNRLSQAEMESLTQTGQRENEPKLWKTRIVVKGHLDVTRAVGFHPTDAFAASGSDDGTVKIWNLKRAMEKGTHAGHDEADQVITYRGHTSAITSVVFSGEQNRVYSAGLDSTIRVWRLPPEGHGPFSPVDPSLNLATYVGHTDAIWDLKLSPVTGGGSCLLASASADGTVKIWDTQASGSLLKSSWTFDGVGLGQREGGPPAPTSIDFCQTDPAKLAVSYNNAKICLFDIETGQVISTLQGSDKEYDGTVNTQINRIVSHPTLPLIVSGHEDRQIKFYDIKSGNNVFSMPAHLAGVTCLDIDPSGTTLVSGGHDSSIRLWDISRTKSCIQEFIGHRRKGDEGVLSVQYHRTQPWMISGGADSTVKIYQHSQS